MPKKLKKHNLINYLNQKFAGNSSYLSQISLPHQAPGRDPDMEMERTMKTIVMTAAVVGLALGAVSPASAGDAKKCEAGMEWDKDAKKCAKKKS